MRSLSLNLFASVSLWISSQAIADEVLPPQGKFSLTYTFTTSTPGKPIDVGANRDLTVNSYLATMLNDEGKGFLHLVAGHCTNIRFTDRTAKTIDTRGYCGFKDKNGDELFMEYTTGLRPSNAIINTARFTSGTGRYEGITGTMEGPNSNNIDLGGAYQAVGKFVGEYKILRDTSQLTYGLHD